MSDSTTTIRPPRPGELDAVADARLRDDSEHLTALVAEHRGMVRFAAVLDARGRTTQPDDPAISVYSLNDGPEATAAAVLEPLLETLIAAARLRNALRITIGWDPMDHAGLKLLEQCGFRPTGDMPYFEHACGHIEFVSGYQDATGSTMDLVREIE